MKNNGVENISIVNIRWNRSNVLFHNAAGTFFYAKTFLLEYFYSLIKFHFYLDFIVVCLLKKTFLTFLRSLSVVCKIVAEPYF